MLTLSMRFYGLRMNLPSAPCGRNHESRRSEAEPLWDGGLEGRLQVVLDHHGEAAELLFVVVRIDYGLFGQRVRFFLAQFRHERKPRRKAAVIAPLDFDGPCGPLPGG